MSKHKYTLEERLDLGIADPTDQRLALDEIERLTNALATANTKAHAAEMCERQAVKHLADKQGEIERLRASVADKTGQSWMKHCKDLADECFRHKAEIERLKRLNATYVKDGYTALDQKDKEIERLRAELERLKRECDGWQKLVNDSERAIGMDSVATVPEARSLVEWCEEAKSKIERREAEREVLCSQLEAEKGKDDE